MKSRIVPTANGIEKFYEFENEEDFNQWGKSVCGVWAEQYNKSSEELNKFGYGIFDKYMATCIEQYCGCIYGHINGYLRGDPSCDKMLEYIFALDKCFRIAPCTNINLLCYRNMSTNEMKNYKTNSLAKGYLSVSAIYENCKKIWDNGKVATVLIPKGIPIVCPSLIKKYGKKETLNSSETELILPRNIIMGKMLQNYIISYRVRKK